MFALGNVEKFLRENSYWISSEVSARIMNAARDRLLPSGIINDESPAAVFGSLTVVDRFARDMGCDPEHCEIALAAMRRNKSNLG